LDNRRVSGGEVSEDRVVRLAAPVAERDQVQGPADAPVMLVEYGDFECPYCRASVAIVDELRRFLGDHLRFVFRHFPIRSLHPHAQHAAEAAEAAGAQGRFFEMHAALFAHQEALEDEDLLRYATDLGLDAARVRQELDARTHAARVREDFESGRASGVRGTPTFYLDGVRYDGIVGVREFLATIRETHPDVVDDDLIGSVGQGRIPRVVRQVSPARPSS
jgi:protein-disulfide isomerase